MRKGLIHLVILLAMLCSGTGVPALAHDHGDHGVQAMDHVESHVGALTDEIDGQDRPADTPGHVVPHHHCSADLTPSGPVMTAATPATRLVIRPTEVARLASRGIVPLIEPPSA